MADRVTEIPEAPARAIRQPRHLKVTQDQYFDAALACLGEQGADGLTITALCRRLGVTSGSFYHYFGGWGGFVEALLSHWETAHTGRIAAMAAAHTDAERRLDVMQREADALPHDAEAAIRAWGSSEPTVRLMLARVDGRRQVELRACIESVGIDRRDADRLATIGVALLIGVQQLRHPVDGDMMRAALGEFRRIIGGYADRARPTG